MTDWQLHSRNSKSKKRKRESTEEGTGKQDNQEANLDSSALPEPKSILRNVTEQKDNEHIAKRDTKKTHFEGDEKVDACTASMSSDKWRKDGNKYYTSATPDVCSAVQEERLKKALQV